MIMGDMIGAFILASTLLVGSVVAILIGAKMRRREISPNPFVGVRTRKAFQSRDDWYAIQSACAPFVILLGFIFLDSAILFLVQGILHEVIPILVPGVIMSVQVAIGIALVHRAASKKSSLFRKRRSK